MSQESDREYWDKVRELEGTKQPVPDVTWNGYRDKKHREAAAKNPKHQPTVREDWVRQNRMPLKQLDKLYPRSK